MSNDKTEAVVALIAMVVCLVAGLVFGSENGVERVQKQAVQHGHAIYNPTNGNFQWKEAK